MFWAGFSWGRRTDLVVMEGDPESPHGGVTAKRYLAVLEEYLPTILEHNSIFMHDNAPIHTARLIENWFLEQVLKLWIGHHILLT